MINIISKILKIALTMCLMLSLIAIPVFAEDSTSAVPDPDDTTVNAEPVNVYQTCYDLINTYVFGGTVVANTYQDLVCIIFSVVACIFLMSLPFLLVWIMIKVWF